VSFVQASERLKRMDFKIKPMRFSHVESFKERVIVEMKLLIMM